MVIAMLPWVTPWPISPFRERDVGAALSEAMLVFTVKLALTVLFEPSVAVTTAVIVCVPSGTVLGCHAVAAAASPPLKSYGAVFSIDLGVPLAVGSSR